MISMFGVDVMFELEHAPEEEQPEEGSAGPSDLGIDALIRASQAGADGCASGQLCSALHTLPVVLLSAALSCHAPSDGCALASQVHAAVQALGLLNFALDPGCSGVGSSSSDVGRERAGGSGAGLRTLGALLQAGLPPGFQVRVHTTGSDARKAGAAAAGAARASYLHPLLLRNQYLSVLGPSGAVDAAAAAAAAAAGLMGHGDEEVLVDLRFRDHLEVPGLASQEYKGALALVPRAFVGTRPELEHLVRQIAALMARGYKAKGMPVPPWRRADALASLWAPGQVRDLSHADTEHSQRGSGKDGSSRGSGSVAGRSGCSNGRGPAAYCDEGQAISEDRLGAVEGGEAAAAAAPKAPLQPKVTYGFDVAAPAPVTVPRTAQGASNTQQLPSGITRAWSRSSSSSSSGRSGSSGCSSGSSSSSGHLSGFHISGHNGIAHSCRSALRCAAIELRVAASQTL